MKIYGIKTCDSVRKAIKFFKENEIEFEFFDYKKEQMNEAKIKEWLEYTTIDKLFNSRGTKYRTLKLKELNLDDAGKIEWMVKENYLIKRPVIEHEGGLVVAFDEELYGKSFL
ncbi:MAG: Spx/MgsR family RNA polymerase-binding regulatory protein [Sulfurovaceae bacterium]|nr:Spx/MgsR family RNA polymerase-binding regulatory protein [Sulfurovaceae bacterium]